MSSVCSSLGRACFVCLSAFALLALPQFRAAADLLPTTAPDSPDADVPVARVDLPAEALPDLASPGGAVPAGVTSVPLGVAPEGDAPHDVAYTPDGLYFLVAHRDSKNLIVVEDATRTFLAAIPLSGSPVSVAISSDGLYAVTANIWEDTASIVDLTTNTEIAVIPVGNQPGTVRISPDGQTAAVGNMIDGNVSVIDLASQMETQRIGGLGYLASVSVNFEVAAISVWFSSFEFVSNDRLLNPDYFGNRIQFVNIQTGTVTNVPTLNSPRVVAVTPDKSKAVVSHAGSVQRVSVVDPAAQSVTTTWPMGVDVWGPITLNPAGTKAVVAIQNAVRVLNLTTGAVSASLNTASVNELLTTADGNHALCVGFNGSLISFATDSIVATTNAQLSTTFGAVNPTAARAAMFADVFGENLVHVSTNGASGALLAITPSGNAPEVDRCRTMAITPDGTKAVVVGILGDTAAVVDLTSNTQLAVVNVGDRPAEVAITPDGSKAVVCNLDSTFTSVINLSTFAVTNVPISTRASQVEISPDGSFAYVAVVTSDGVWRINLNTLTTAGAKLTTGNMGGIGYAFSQTSGMTLSHDGATLVTCNSFDNTISIIDTASWTVVKTLAVGTFPVRAVFSADDSTLYVCNRDTDSISIVSVVGAGSVVTGTIAVGDMPFEMALASDGSRLYVLNTGPKSVGRVILPGATQSGTIVLLDPPIGLHLAPGDASLNVASGNWTVSIGPGPVIGLGRSGQFSTIETAGFTLASQIATGQPPAMLAVHANSGLAVMPAPFVDGYLRFGGLAPCPEDCSGDGQRDQADLALLLSCYNTGACCDVDGNGITDQADLAALLAVYSIACP